MKTSKINITVNSSLDNSSQGISIERLLLKNPEFLHAHRDDGHSFHIIEKGTIHIEIDFSMYKIAAPSIVYMHPNQVHRIAYFKNIIVCSLSVKEENLNPDYLSYLEEINPSKPLKLNREQNLIISDLTKLCLMFSSDKTNRLQFSLLKDSCNTLIAFLTSQFLIRGKSQVNLSRYELTAKAFKQLLDKHYTTSKRPAEYAGRLNISTSYLNECVKSTTGISVSQCIRNRIILEAKRLLYHTARSVKEISFELGYEDYPYFSRIFTRATGMSALAFRNKNRE